MAGALKRPVSATTHYGDLITDLAALGRMLVGRHRTFDHVAQFEREFARLESSWFAIADAMARIAFFHSLKALGLSAGERVLMSPVTIPEMLAVVESLKLEPVFVDFSEKTLTVCPQDLERKAQSGARVFLLTHVAGQISDMKNIRAVCDRFGIKLIQDCTQANGSAYGGKPLSQWADISIYSTCEFKYVHTYRGGVICVNSEELHRQLRSVVAGRPAQGRWGFLRKWSIDSLITLITHPLLFGLVFHRLRKKIFTQDPLRDRTSDQARRSRFELLGSDYHEMKNGIPRKMLYRFSDLAAWKGLDSLRALEVRIGKHRDHAERLEKALSTYGVVPPMATEASGSCWRFPIVLPTREAADEFMRQMWKRDVIVERSGLSVLSVDAPHARSLMSRMVLLPAHAKLDASDLERVIGAARETLAQMKFT
jgi:dTDP-4-amino-4,6-dideoxygalactose transaminase